MNCAPRYLLLTSFQMNFFIYIMTTLTLENISTMFRSGFSRISIQLSRHNCYRLEYKYSENGLINHEKSPDGKFTNLWIVILLKSKPASRGIYGKNQEERKIPVIVVKKRRTFSLPSLSEKTDIIESAFTEQAAESAPSE